jgi:hypothetical protein
MGLATDMAATPYGYYYSCVKAFQANQVIGLLRLFREEGIPVRSGDALRPPRKFTRLQQLTFASHGPRIAQIPEEVRDAAHATG